nr:MAG TPA: hypothetical protein [Caudoviricetes sp.]
MTTERGFVVRVRANGFGPNLSNTRADRSVGEVVSRTYATHARRTSTQVRERQRPWVSASPGM